MEIKNSDVTKEKGLFATKKYAENEVVRVLSGNIYDKPTRETIHIGDNKHVHDEYGIYINHSFTPNIKIDGYKLVALQDIGIGDELFFNYNDTEVDMSNPFYVGDTLVSGNKTK